MKPSEMILEIRKEIAKERLSEMKKDPSFAFINAISGGTEDKTLSALEFDNTSSIAAILLYLDRTQGNG